ncbi:MAG: radical SAM protein [Deltaproteobacteria bacterium]|nr:radical SAM protein [Deltaproteobacteria bacterium]
MSERAIRNGIRERLRGEVGRPPLRDERFKVVALYPSPYAVGMSSLGFQTIARLVGEHPGVSCDRAFLPNDPAVWRVSRVPLFGYESGEPVRSARVVAVSVAYELEVQGLIEALDLAGLEPLAAERGPNDPLVLAGGPLTFSNPLPLGPFVDAVILGEAEDLVGPTLDALLGASSRREALDALERLPSTWIPSRHGERLPALAVAGDSWLPAHSPIVTPGAELASMALVEAERGCSRGCTYCVMRRENRGPMRLATVDRILARIPAHARKVGLVGAGVSDHPAIVEVVSRLADGGRSVSLSSLRPDRLDDAFVGALARAGAQSLTTAVDGASERLRLQVKRGGKTEHLRRAAELARAHGLGRLKLYVMLGLPGETDDDVDELADLATDLSRRCPVSLGVAPFVSKRGTPLDGLPFAGIATITAGLRRLKSRLRGRAEVRPTSARWAWVEWVLAQGTMSEGRAVLDAWRAGGGFAAHREAFRRIARPRQRPVLGASP